MDWTGQTKLLQTIYNFVLLILVTVFPFATALFLNRFRSKLHNEKTKTMFGSLYEDVKVNHGFNHMQIPFFLLRRLVLAATIIFMQNYVVVQLFLSTFGSLYYCNFLLGCSPYENLKLNFIEFYNEIAILFSIYTCYFFTPFVDNI